ncbi:MAG: Do family serine endopeptidase [Deltaproteobacteria bacterium]|jgi:serine protease Do
MKDFKFTLMVSLVACAFLIALTIGVRSQAVQTKPQVDTSPQGTAGSGGVPDQLDRHFNKAQDDLSRKNSAGAVTELQKAAALIEGEEKRSENNAKQLLAASVRELKQLAQRLEAGNAVSELEIRHVFARAHQALALNYQLKASESVTQKTTSGLGQDIKAAAEHLEKAWYWSGHQLETAAKAVIDRSKKLGEKIESGAQWAAAEVADSVDDLRHEIGIFRSQLTSENSPSVTFAASRQETGPIKKVNASAIDLTTAIIQVATANIPAVVHITVTERQEVPNPLLPYENNPFFQRYFGLPKKMPKKFERELIGVGSGILIDSQGHILTNNHVVAGATKIQVKLSDGSTYSAKVLGTDPKTDLGVIQISADHPLPFATFEDSDKVQVGQWVVAIGQPESLSESVTQGVISAKHRTGITDPSNYQDFLQTDAAINPGNSGGPLLNLNGNVIGINSAIFSTTGGFQGIGFAIPSNMAAHVADQLMKYGKVKRGWLGVTLQELTPKLAQSFGLSKPEGALVTQVMKGGPADKAGFKPGDVITAMQGKKISNVAELRNAVADTPVGQEIDLTILRNGKTEQLKVKIGNLEDMNKQLAAMLKKRLGILVKPIPELQASAYGLKSSGGVMIQWVDSDGPLGKLGFEVNDIILAVNNHPVEDVETFTSLVDSLPPGQTIVLIARDHRTGQEGRVQVKLG